MFPKKVMLISTLALISFISVSCSNIVDTRHEDKATANLNEVIENCKKISITDDNVYRLPVNSAQYGSNGDFLICAENEILRSDNLNQISLYNLATKDKTVLAHIKNSRYQIDEPQIEKEWAAWVIWDRIKPSNYTIYKYNLISKQKRIVRISELDTKSLGLVRLVLDNGRLVAIENTDSEDFADVNLYNLSDNTCNNLGKSLISELPEIEGNFVAWKGVDEESNTVAVYVYNINTGEKRAIKNVDPDTICIQIDGEKLLLHTTSKLSIYSLTDLNSIKTLESKTGFFNADMEDEIICWSSYDESKQVFLYSLSKNETFILENIKGSLPRLFNGSLLYSFSEYPLDRSKAYNEIHIIDDIKARLGIYTDN